MSLLKHDALFAVLFIVLFAVAHGVIDMNQQEFEQQVGSKPAAEFNRLFPVDEFIQGQKDCKAGIPARKDTEDYLRGYSFQYHLEQMQSARSER